MAQNSSSSGGVSTLGVLLIVFVVLKLCGLIDWSWWWVTLPFWGPLAVGLAVVAIWLAAVGVSQLQSKRRSKT